MKALALILLGFSLATYTGVQLLTDHALTGTLLGALHFLGLIIGIILALCGLISNHRDHTRKH